MLQVRMFTELWAVQERAKELAAHEEQLEEWKKRFKAEALRQIGERERALADWQAQLDAKRADLEDLKKNMEARPFFPCDFSSLHTSSVPHVIQKYQGDSRFVGAQCFYAGRNMPGIVEEC